MELALLREMDMRRTSLTDSIDHLKSLGKEGVTIILKLTVIEALNRSYPTADITLYSNGTVSFKEAKNIGEDVEFELTSPEGTVEITLKSEDSESTVYTFSLKDFPVGETTTSEVESAEGGGRKIRVKVQLDTLDARIQATIDEHQVVEEDIARLSSELRGEVKPASSKKKKSSKKSSSGRSVKFRSNQVEVEDDEPDKGISSLEKGKQYGMLLVGGLIQYRAVLLFGVSALLIAKYGDVASV